MRDRLTPAASSLPVPAWVGWMPALFVVVALAGLFPQGTSAFAALLATAALLLACGGLLRRLVPAKSPAAVGGLAFGLGVAMPVLLRGGELAALSPAWGVVLFGVLQGVDSAEARWKAGPAGVLLGLALLLDPRTLVFVLPVFAGATVSLLLAFRKVWPRFVLLAAGLLIGLAPLFLGQAGFVCPLRVAGGEVVGPWVPPAWTWFFLLLGGAVGLAQRLPTFWGLLLPAYALGAGLRWWGHEEPATGLVVALVCAYGAFRILRGVETGGRKVNPGRAKALPAGMLFVLFALFCGWSASTHLLP